MPSTSKKQHNLMAAVAKNPAFAKKVGIKQSVGAEFMKADKGRKFKEGGAMDMAQDKKLVKKAVKMHDQQLHGGKKTNLSKLAKGGYCGGGKMKKYAEGGSVKKDFKVIGLDGKETNLKEGVYEPEMMKAENNPTRRAFESAVEGVKSVGKRLKDNVMGTEEQNKAAKERLDKAGKFVKGGKVRGCGCATKGKTKGRMV